MGKIVVALTIAGTGVLATASAAGAMPSERACNQGTMRAHATVPYNPKSAAHANIPHCMMP